MNIITDANKNQAPKNLLKQLGLNDLPQSKKDELSIKMSEVVLRRIFIETMEKLNEGDRKIYENMLDSQTESAELEKFLREKISDYDNMILRIIIEFKEEMKDNNI